MLIGCEKARAPLPDQATAPVKVFLLGRFEVVRGDAPIPHAAWRRRRPADLLKLVALAPGRALPRDRAVEALWPDKDGTSGANNLHRALYDLRQILGGRFVDLEHGELRMRPEVWVDVDAFQAAAEAQALEEAVALYRGDLAPDDPDAAWLEAPRAALRRRFAEAALPLARQSAERRDAARAIPLLRRVLEVDGAPEEPHLLLVRLLAEAGRRADALRQLDAAEAALRAREPKGAFGELLALREAVLRGEIGPSQPRLPYDGWRRAARRLLGTSEPSPLRGRASSLLLLESLVEQGSGALVLLGERGVGKTRLAVEGARRAQEAGAVVACGVFQAAAGQPFAGFADLFADYLRSGGLGAEDPFAGRPAPAAAAEAEKARLFAAVRAQVLALGGGRPVCLLLDDLHRADESSANLLHYLAREARALRLLVIATCREDAVHAGAPVEMLLAHLDCERLARGVRVQRLDLAATREQLGDLLGTPPSDALAAQFYRTTDGSPFYTEELARAFRESGHLRAAGADPAAAVRERVARLGPRVLALLEAAAVAGRHFDVEVVKPATGLTAHEVVGALEQVLEARLVDEDGAGHHFHHSLVREALYAALPPARRVALHRAIADAVEARAAATPGGLEDAADALAHHRTAGEQPERAFGHLVAAGHRAAARAGLREAAAAYERALAFADLAGASGPRRLEVLEALGQVQLLLAELPGAGRSFELGAALSKPSGWRPGPEQRARARRGAALALLVGGRAAEARAQLDAALADAEAGAGDERAEVLHLQAQLAWHEARFEDARAAALRCAEAARTAGDTALAGRGLDLAALAAGALGAPPPGAPVERAEPGPELPFEVHLVLWENDLLGDRPVAALARQAAALRARAASRQAPLALATARAVEGALSLAAGRLDVAEAELREARALFQRGGSALGEALALDRLGALLTARGSVEEGMALLGEGVLAAERAALRRHALCRLHATVAHNRLAAGALYAAEDALREASELAARHGECAVCHALFRPELVRVQLLRGRLAEAAADASELEALAARHGGRALAAVARRTRGRVLAAEGAHAAAAAALREAAAVFEGLGAAVDAARSAELAARSLRAARLPDGEVEADALERAAAAALAAAGVAPER